MELEEWRIKHAGRPDGPTFSTGTGTRKKKNWPIKTMTSLKLYFYQYLHRIKITISTFNCKLYQLDGTSSFIRGLMTDFFMVIRAYSSTKSSMLHFLTLTTTLRSSTRKKKFRSKSAYSILLTFSIHRRSKFICFLLLLIRTTFQLSFVLLHN
jgi:hypothetical protein